MTVPSQWRLHRTCPWVDSTIEDGKEVGSVFGLVVEVGSVWWADHAGVAGYLTGVVVGLGVGDELGYWL